MLRFMALLGSKSQNDVMIQSASESEQREFSNREVTSMTANQFDLSNNMAVFTGGNGGIGRGIALAFAAAGASVAIIGRNEDKNEAVLRELELLGVKACALAVDVTAYSELPAAIESIQERLGSITVLVNNAG